MVKHGGGGGIMQWGCFPIQVRWKRRTTCKFFNLIPKQLLDGSNLDIFWCSNRRTISNTSKLVSDSIKQTNDKLLERVFQSPNLSPIENMWLKSHVCASKPTYFNLLYQFAKKNHQISSQIYARNLTKVFFKNRLQVQLAENINQIRCMLIYKCTLCLILTLYGLEMIHNE